ncbi:MAG: twin-arginine translocation signal domain-containing protein, partial [Acidobacteriota bacterium]
MTIDRTPKPHFAAKFSRRKFVKTATLGAVTLGAVSVVPSLRPQAKAVAGANQRIPLKIGLRAASMKMVGNLEVFKMARQIPGLLGVELQVAAGNPNLRDWDTVRHYKTEADRWGVMVPSLAGVWDRGVSIRRSPVAGINLIQSIRAAELLGSS